MFSSNVQSITRAQATYKNMFIKLSWGRCGFYYYNLKRLFSHRNWLTRETWAGFKKHQVTEIMWAMKNPGCWPRRWKILRPWSFSQMKQMCGGWIQATHFGVFFRSKPVVFCSFSINSPRFLDLKCCFNLKIFGCPPGCAAALQEDPFRWGRSSGPRYLQYIGAAEDEFPRWYGWKNGAHHAAVIADMRRVAPCSQN